MDLTILLKLTIISFYFGHSFANSSETNNGLTLNILHTNDMYSRFEQTSEDSTINCPLEDAANDKCYGGFARISTLVKKARNSSIQTIFLNAGNTFHGSTWYAVHKWAVCATFLNLLQPDVISLGNHEFDEGIQNLTLFINNTNFPIVAANINYTGESELVKKKLNNSYILKRDGHEIGVIGYLAKGAKGISSIRNIEFSDEVKSIRKEVVKLQKKGVKIIIALGNSGFEVDKKIAAEVDGVDLVIGGYTKTFLYSGKDPSSEKQEGLYPTEVKQKNGRKVYVVQAYAYTKYLGNLTVEFDGEGEIKNIEGNPVLMDSSIKEDQKILDELKNEKWRSTVGKVANNIVGTTNVLLNGDKKVCRVRECNLANFIADAMIDYNVRLYRGEFWTDAAIAILNSGSVLSSIEKSTENKIAESDILALVYSNDVMVKMKLSGKVILQMLEHSVHHFKANDTSDLRGGFLQFSGLQVVYDLSQPAGSRVKSVSVRCAKCKYPVFEKLHENNFYKVLMPDFIGKGGDGFKMLLGIPFSPMDSEVTISKVIVDYISKHNLVYPGLESRIQFLDSQLNNIDKKKTSNGRIIHGTIAMMIVPIIIQLI